MGILNEEAKKELTKLEQEYKWRSLPLICRIRQI